MGTSNTHENEMQSVVSEQEIPISVASNAEIGLRKTITNADMVSFFVRTCCTPPIDSLIEYNGRWAVANDCILEKHDKLVGKYIPPDHYGKETYFSLFGIYTYFNCKKWNLIKYSMIESIDLFPHTIDYFYNLTHPHFFVQTRDNQIIPLYIRPKRIIRDDGTHAFDEIFRLERFIQWAICPHFQDTRKPY